MSNPDGYFGTQTADTRGGDYNAMVFVIRQLLSTRCHVALVKVIEVEGKLLGVQPMVNQLDADGNAIPHGVINGIPYFTLQAGGNGVTMAPEVGDTGLCLFADRDISSVKVNRDVSNPGSMRQSDMADGLYLGGFLNDAPTQYIDFSAKGVHIHSPVQIKLTAGTNIRMEAPSITMVAPAAIIMDTPAVSTSGAMIVGGGATGTFSTPQGTVVTVKDGIITNIF